MSRILALAASVSLLAFAAPVLAADIYEEAPAATRDVATDVVIELGVGGRLQPDYEGSDEYEVSPFPIISLEYLNVPGLFEIGGGDGQGSGLSIGPSFGYQSERDSGDYDDLNGLDDIDATYEAGIKASYEWSYAEVYGAARYAFGGADGVVGEFGANLIARPAPAIELKAGPFATLASSGYADTYFGVSREEFFNTDFRLDPYEPEGGFKSVGVSAGARYEFRPDWFLNADASYSQFVGDFKDSPVVEVGSDEQFTFGLGLSKRFSLDLF